MFLKVVPVKGQKQSYRYLKLVESYRKDGKVKQRIVANLGNLDVLQTTGKLERLLKSFSRFSKEKYFLLSDLKGKVSFSYGDILISNKIWENLFLSDIIFSSLKERFMEFDPVLCAKIMVINRLILPKSKLSVTSWQKRIYLPELKEYPSYQHFLRTLDLLAEKREEIEQSLFLNLSNLFSLPLNLIFYDLTSTYFEGTECSLSEFGYSRDKREDCRQIILALAVTEEGLPITHEVFKGNTADKKTLKEMVTRLKRRFDIKKIIFVGDRGLISKENLLKLESEGYEYIMALKKRHFKKAKEIIDEDLKNYPGIEEHLLVKEVKEEKRRYLICHNEKKAKDDRAFREQLIKRVEKELESLKGKKGEKILLKAGEILGKRKAKRYFEVFLASEDKLTSKLKDEVLKEEEILDGKYILFTNNLSLSAADVVKAYKNLTRVEEAFKEIKDFLRLRPIHHYTEERVRAHVFICCLAYLLERLLGRYLKKEDLDLSPRRALQILEEIKLVEIEAGERRVRLVTEVSPEAKRIFSALGIKKIPSSISS